MPLKPPTRRAKVSKADYIEMAKAAIDKLAEVKKRAKEVGKEESVLIAEVKKHMADADEPTILTDNGNRGTVTATTSMVLDEAGLKKQLGAAVWNGLLVRVLDRDLLAQAVADGHVAATTVAKHTKIVTAENPTLRITAAD